MPYPDKTGSWKIRYYQEIAVERVLERIADGADRILLTLATGTGKTSIAFQIAWKLFQTRWNLSREPTRRPHILFLADRCQTARNFDPRSASNLDPSTMCVFRCSRPELRSVAEQRRA